MALKSNPEKLAAEVAAAVPSDSETVNAIHKILDGVEWTPDTLDAIAEQITATGRKIRDPEEF